MFFVRPARHAACPRRLKFMHSRSFASSRCSLLLIIVIDIKNGFITYVEDSPNYSNRTAQKNAYQNVTDLDMDKTNGFGLCKCWSDCGKQRTTAVEVRRLRGVVSFQGFESTGFETIVWQRFLTERLSQEWNYLVLKWANAVNTLHSRQVPHR